MGSSQAREGQSSGSGLQQETAPRPSMTIVTSPKAAAWIAERGGEVWVWLDPRRGLVGSFVWLEAHCAAPRSTRQTSFTRSSRRPHRFRTMRADGFTIHYDWGRLDPPMSSIST